VTDKAAKRDDAGVPTHLWDQHCSLVLLHTSPALETLRRLLIRVASRHMVDKFRSYSEEAYGADWLVSLYEGSDITAQGHSSRKQKRSQGVESDNSIMHDELLKDVVAGADAIARFADSDWWSWKQGLALFFWRWPKGEQRSFARDGMPPWIKTRLPRYTRRPRPPDPDKKPLVLVKLQTIIVPQP
jgi:hypothetical protein